MSEAVEELVQHAIFGHARHRAAKAPNLVGGET